MVRRDKIDNMLDGMYAYREKGGVDMLNATEKERILKDVMGKIEEQKRESAPDDNSIIGIEEGSRKQKKSGRKYVSRLTRAAAAVAITVLVAGSVGVVGAKVFHWDQKFSSYFGSDEPDDGTLEDNVRSVSASDTCNGVTVSVDQIVGDDYGFYMLLNVKGISEKAAESFGSAVEAEFGFKDTDVTIKDEDNILTSSPVYMGSDDGVYSFIVKVNSSNMTGKDINLNLKNFGYTENFEKFHTVAKGTWNLKWNLSYENNAEVIDVNKSINIYGGKAKWDSMSISPLSVSVKLTPQGNYPETVSDDTKINDQLYVDLADGTRINSTYASDTDVYNDFTDISLSFRKICKLDDIVSVTFAGVTYQINPDKVQHKNTYENDEMGFDIQFSDDLYSIITASKTVKEQDIDFGKKSEHVSFIANKNGVKMSLFTVYKVKGMWSPKQVYRKSPFRQYLTYSNGYTYMMGIGEITSQEENDEYADILNNEISNIKNFISLK